MPSTAQLFGPLRSTVMFFKIMVFLVISQCQKRKRNVRFLAWCAGVATCVYLLVVSVHLLVVCSLLLVVCGSLLVVCGHLLLFADGLWLFVVVCGSLWLLPVLVTTVSGDLVVKSKLSPHSGSVALRQLNRIHEKGP